MAKKNKDEYGIAKLSPKKRIAAPELPYEPRDPVSYRPAIGLLGCGGITAQHLTAYRNAGYHVAALCDIDLNRAESRRAEFFPNASVYTDYREVLERPDIEVVDIATHPPERAELIEAAILAHKHVLSQKPFVMDLDLGARLADLADREGVKLAVNQNGRWAPHFSYIRRAIDQGLLGEVFAAHLSVHWNHGWIADSGFNELHHIILYDFAIHWFDIVTQFFAGRDATRVYATLTRTSAQTAKPPLLGQVLVEYEGGQASLVFDADTRFGEQDSTYVTGTHGTVFSTGPDLRKQKVTLYTSEGFSSPTLTGSWFPDGFHGSMAELLCAIEEDRIPQNNARDNLKSLALCFAAVASADDGQPKVPGTVKTVPV